MTNNGENGHVTAGIVYEIYNQNGTELWDLLCLNTDYFMQWDLAM